jgi:hypothetical protein
MKPMICELKIHLHIREHTRHSYVLPNEHLYKKESGKEDFSAFVWLFFTAKRQAPVGMPVFYQGEEKVSILEQSLRLMAVREMTFRRT